MDQNNHEFLGISATNLIVYISIITAGLYVNSIVYFHSYFRALGIPQIFFQLPLEFYVTNGIIPIIMATLIGLITSFGIFVESNHPLIKNAGNFSFLIGGFFSCLMCYFGAFTMLADIFIPSSAIITTFKWTFFILGAGFCCYFIYLGYKKKIPLKEMWHKNDLHKICVIGIILIVTIIISLDFGYYMANRTIDGVTADVSQVEFHLSDNSTTNIDNSNLFLFFYNNGNYYAFSKNQTTGKLSELYIIPEKTIDFAKLSRRI